MTLLWAEGFTGEKALAPAWRRYALAAARGGDKTLPAEARFTATIEAESAKIAYDALAAEAETALAGAAAVGSSRTHALVVGVGRYEDPRIPALTTSVYGAWAFADWMLTRFQHADRPLGSVELVLSAAPELGDWKPSAVAAEKLGVVPGEGLPVEAATFAQIREAFKRWIARSGRQPDNAAFLYFSGHGVWKSATLLLPEDARLPGNAQSAENLINIQQTQANMFNAQPSVQCFFVDSCQEITPALLQNLDTTPGEPLYRPTNGATIPRRDAWIYYGSYTGRKAYGPEDAAPFFTQELLGCLEKRGADSGFDGTWRVTTDSLWRTLEAASYSRQETEGHDIQFSKSTDTSNFTAELCQIGDAPEVFVKVRCLPPEAMGAAKLYVESAGARHFRPKVQTGEWYTPVPQGDCLAGAEFDAAATLAGTSNPFRAWPPVSPVALKIQPRPPGGGGGT
jgi:hypothetical protein